MGYEVFERTSIRASAPKLSIVPGGRIAINAAAVRILVKAGVGFVVLLWDKDTRRVALKSTSKGNKNAFAISITPDQHSGSLRAKSFLAHIGWNAPHRQMLDAYWNEKEKMFEMTMPQEFLDTGEAAGSGAKRIPKHH